MAGVKGSSTEKPIGIAAGVWTVVALGLVFLAALYGFVGYEIWRQRNVAIARLEGDLGVFADLLAGECRQVLVGVEAAMGRIALDQALSASGFSAEDLRRSVAALPMLAEMMVVEGGEGPVGALHSLVPARRRDFIAAVAHDRLADQRTLRLGAVVAAPFDGAPVIPVSRPLREGADSAAKAGMIVAALPVAHFQALFSRSRMFPHVSVVLAGLDGRILAQSPEGGLATLADAAEFNPSGRESGGLRLGDGDEDRLVALRTLHPFGVRLSVSMPIAQGLRPWRADAQRLGLATLLASLALGVTLAAMVRALRNDGLRANRLLNSERRLRLAQFSLDNCADMVVCADGRGRIVYANKAVRDRLGYGPEEVEGLSVGDIDPGFPAAEWPQRMEDLRQARQIRFDSHLRTRAGQKIPVEVSVTLFHHDGREFTCAVIRDMVERRRNEAVLAERTARLEASNAELEQFVQVASHDLREPLRMIGSFLGLLSHRFGATLEPEAREFMEFARQGALRLDRLILDLVEFASIGAAPRPLLPVDLNDVAAAARRDLTVAIAEAGARVVIAPDLPMVLGQRDELVRLLGNLLGNALKYRDSTRPLTVQLAAGCQEGVVTCTVRDNGIGIAPQYYDRIFRIFQRLHPRGRFDGTGIGLAVCKKVVERHGGRIWVSSTPDEGSIFFFTLRAPPAA